MKGFGQSEKGFGIENAAVQTSPMIAYDGEDVVPKLMGENASVPFISAGHDQTEVAQCFGFPVTGNESADFYQAPQNIDTGDCLMDDFSGGSQ